MSSDGEKTRGEVEHATGKWQCQYCHNYYSHTYRQKTHVDKCVVLNKRRDDEEAVLISIKDELRK